jgi:hypothetical protein
VERDDDDVLDECECGCREAGFAFAGLATVPVMAGWPAPAAPWRPKELTR